MYPPKDPTRALPPFAVFVAMSGAWLCWGPMRIFGGNRSNVALPVCFVLRPVLLLVEKLPNVCVCYDGLNWLDALAGAPLRARYSPLLAPVHRLRV